MSLSNHQQLRLSYALPGLWCQELHHENISQMAALTKVVGLEELCALALEAVNKADL